MNPASLKEAEKLFTGVVKSISNIKKTEIVICPPFLYLPSFAKALSGKGKIKNQIFFGAQNIFWEKEGAHTGEVSGDMLYNIGARYVIVGHSERRALGENNFDINKKIKASISSGLIPILCIGENLRDEDHEYLNFIKIQIEECLSGISKNSISKVILAYEPIWAIGKGALPAKPEEFLEMSIFIRKILSDKFGFKEIENIKIIYGGSISEKNVEEFIKIGNADGLLVGRASLNPKKFSEIIKKCEQ